MGLAARFGISAHQYGLVEAWQGVRGRHMARARPPRFREAVYMTCICRASLGKQRSVKDSVERRVSASTRIGSLVDRILSIEDDDTALHAAAYNSTGCN